MRIVLVVAAFPRLSETFIVSKFLGLLDRGLDLHVVCQGSDPQEYARFPQLQSRPGRLRRVRVSWPARPRWLAACLIPAALIRCLIRNPAGTSRYLRRGWRQFRVDTLRQLYLESELIAGRPGLIHFEFGPLAVGRTLLKEALGCRMVVSFRGYDLNYVGLDREEYYRDVWESADALHLLGEDLWRRAQGRGCPSDKPHALISPAIDTDFFRPGDRERAEVVGTPERPLRLLSVGRLEWKKGYEYALQAVRLLINRQIHCDYRIIGEGSYVEWVTLARHQLGLEEVVQLQGAQSRDEVREQHRWADVFLHAAVSEGFCNAVLEAQAMRLPVVCTDADGLAENVLDGVTGWVVPRRNPQAIADKLCALALDPALRDRMGCAGRERVVARFGLADQIAAFEALYRRLLAQRDSEEERRSHAGQFSRT
jgi:colanic acid/amylovoran biosynthesis glycosyltransferase